MAGDIDLFDAKGHPLAYVARDSQDIVTWRGEAVAYLVDRNQVFGWNGRHLGWLENGMVHDLNGRAVGFVRQRCPVPTFVLPAKYPRTPPRARARQEPAHVRPILSPVRSAQTFADFLAEGAIDVESDTLDAVAAAG